ncbi:MAG: ABC transporter permease [Actinomycetales bacterium]|nr:ABC transporter permease [Actinomycetales bacterium]
MSDLTLKTGQEGTAGEQFKAYLSRLRAGDMGSLPAVGALVVLVILFSSLSPYFFTTLNFANLFVQAATLMMISSALVFVILLGEIDLSAGVTAGTGMAVFVKMNLDFPNIPWGINLAIAFALAIATGSLIGYFVAKIGVPSFVVSLALYLAFPGIMLIILGDGGVLRLEVPEVKAIMNENLPTWGGWAMLGVAVLVTGAMGLWDRARRIKAQLPVRPITFLIIKVAGIVVLGAPAIWVLNTNRSLNQFKPIAGVPMVIPIALFILFVATFALDRTRFGRHLYAVGGNPEAARRAGIKVAKIRISAFIICSFLAMIGGVFNVSRIGNVESSAGKAIVLSGVAAAVVGGVSLFGGRGRLAHAAIGAFVIAIIDNGLGLLGQPAGINWVVTGSVLLIAATIDALARKRSGASLTRS